jgi:acyl dehydratase
MPVDQSLVGRAYPTTAPHTVTEDGLRRFAEAVGGSYAGRAPATYPIVLAFEAMNAFLADEGVELSRIVHGEQQFAYERPIAAGDVLTATLTVAGLRQIGGNDIIRTSSEIRDGSGSLVCTAGATLVHRGDA